MWAALIASLGAMAAQSSQKQYQNDYNEEQAEADRQFQREMVESQRAWDLEMWNRQNDYNTPASQMERYRAAGLNPNIIYGSGNAIAGQASNHPTSSTPNMALNRDSVNIGGIEAFMNMFGQIKGAEKMDSDMTLNLAKTKTEMDTQSLITAQTDEVKARTRALGLANERTALDNFIFSLPWQDARTNAQFLDAYKQNAINILGLEQSNRIAELNALQENWQKYKTQNIDSRWGASIAQLNKSDSDFSRLDHIVQSAVIQGVDKSLDALQRKGVSKQWLKNKHGKYVGFYPTNPSFLTWLFENWKSLM